MAAPLPSSTAPAANRAHDWHRADRVAATASLLCAIHCAALPFALALLPAIGLGLLGGHGFDVGFVAFAALLATSTLTRGYQQHRRRRALLLAAPGFLLLLAGLLCSSERVWHPLLMVLGGGLVASAHLLNLRLLGGVGTASCAACSARG